MAWPIPDAAEKSGAWAAGPDGGEAGQVAALPDLEIEAGPGGQDGISVGQAPAGPVWAGIRAEELQALVKAFSAEAATGPAYRRAEEPPGEQAAARHIWCHPAGAARLAPPVSD